MGKETKLWYLSYELLYMLSIDENIDSAWVKYFSYISFEEIENKHRGGMGREDGTPVTGLTPPHVCVFQIRTCISNTICRGRVQLFEMIQRGGYCVY